MATIRELLDDATALLREAGIDFPGREAALLLGSLLEMSASALLAHDHDLVAPETADRFARWIERRRGGEPAAYLLGRREFYGRELAVDDRVLVPRPETEHLVEIALALPLPSDALVLDVGTGSGNVAVTLAAERSGWRVVAVDRSLAALLVARENAERHGVAGRVRFATADLTAALALGAFDLVVANLPYVDDQARGAVQLAHEPGIALFSAHEGRAAIESLLVEAASVRDGVHLACEIGASQADDLVAAADPNVWELIELRRDLAGLDRDLVWKRRAR